MRCFAYFSSYVCCNANKVRNYVHIEMQYETDNAQLHMLMTNVVAGGMNFAGRSKKTGIVEMQLLNALVGEL